MTDHLARLCFEGPGFAGPGSSGRYTPHAYSLRLQGVHQPTDHVVFLHEVHHASLNDVTAWGSALHVFARLPGDARHQFGPLLDACRVTHESLATFASVYIASARHGALDHVLAAYPSYIPLNDATVRLTAGVEGAARRQMMASALARLCMQAPVPEMIVASDLDAFRLASVRDLDRPDGRWNWFIRQGADLLAAAASTADRAVLADFGPAALASDGPDGGLHKSTDRAHDEAWDFWEASAYEQLRTALAAAGARTLSINGHQDGTAALLALVHARHGDIGLRPAMSDQQRHEDAAVASSVLQQVRHDLHEDDRHRAALLLAVDAVQLVELMANRPIIADQPAMIVDARPASRLAALYRWPAGVLPEQLGASAGPVVAVRAAIDDGGPDAVVGHLVVPEPDELAVLSQRWRSRGPLVSCVSASCLADADWARRWVPPFSSFGTMFVLVDVEPDRFVPAWARDGRQVTAIDMTIDDAGGQRAAMLFTAGSGLAWWLVLADDVTVRLMAEYLRGCLGPRLRSDMELSNPIRDAATVVISHLLATESFVSFDALGISNAD
jgi:hypothetical protein